MGELARMLEGAEDDKDSNQRVKFAGVIAEQRGLLKSDSKEIGKIVIQRQVAKKRLVRKPLPSRGSLGYHVDSLVVA